MVNIEVQCNYMWPDLRKGVFHTHPIVQNWKIINLLSNDIWSWNFLQPLTYVGTFCLPNFKSIALSNLTLRIVKVGKLDVCGRPLFANPVTYIQWSCESLYKLLCIEVWLLIIFLAKLLVTNTLGSLYMCIMLLMYKIFIRGKSQTSSL